MTKDMYVKSNWFFILYKALLVIAAAYGLHFHMAAGKWGAMPPNNGEREWISRR